MKGERKERRPPPWRTPTTTIQSHRCLTQIGHFHICQATSVATLRYWSIITEMRGHLFRNTQIEMIIDIQISILVGAGSIAPIADYGYIYGQSSLKTGV